MSDESARRDRGTVFVGRAGELAALKAALALAATGSGRVVMLVGEAGIGKTRTAAEFAAQVHADDTLVLRGGCYEGEWAPSYGPFVEALTTYIRRTDPPQLREELGFGGPPLGRLLPAVRERLPDVPEPVALQPDEERFRLFDAVSQFLIAIAKTRTVVLLLDDLHWADKGTIALLRYVARFGPEHRLMFVGVYRGDEVDSAHPLAELLGVLRRESTYERVLLKGLDREETGELIAALAQRGLAAGVVTDIHRRTQGNPFFVRETMQHLIEENRLAGEQSALPDLTVPEGIRYVIERRLARLSGEANRLLTVASAFDGPFRYDVAAVVAELESDATLEAIDDALRAQLIEPATDADTYDFTHALIRHTLYTTLSPSRRVRLHRKIAEGMERGYGERVSEHAHEIAEHYHRSMTLPGAERGVSYALLAADQTEGRAAFAAAAGCLRVALDLQPTNDPQRPRTLARLSLALTWAVMFDEASAVAREAAELIARAEGRNAAADYLAEVVRALIEAGAQSHLCSIARCGLEYTDERRDVTWAVLKAVDIVEREASDPAGLGIPLDTLERKEVSQILMRDAASAAGSWGFLQVSSRNEIVDTRLASSANFFWAGDYRRGLRVQYAEATHHEQHGKIAVAATDWAQVSRLHVALGEFSQATEARERSAALAARLLGPAARTLYLIAADDEWRMALDEGWGTPAENAGAGPDQESLARFRATGHAAIARTHARMGRVPQALRRLSTVLPAIARAPAWAENYTRITCDAAETLWLTNRTDHIDVVERNLRTKVVEPDFRYPMVDGRLALARLCALQGRYNEAAEWFAKARVVLDEQEARPLRAVADYDEALMYARRGADGDRERARPLLDAALTQFRALGMPGWIRRAEHLLATGAEWSPATQPDTPQRQPEIVQPETRDQEPETCLFRCEGDVWAVTFAGATHRLKDTRGLHYLAHLSAHPRREFHVNEIATRSATPTSSARVERELPTAVDLGDAGELLDGEATAQYQQRLAEVREQLEEAQANNDIGRHDRLREELEFLIAELASAGRGRRAASHAERARSAVGKRIRGALKQIGAIDAPLGRYLRATVRIGTFCSYTPDPRLRVECEV